MGKMNLLKGKWHGKVGQTVGAKWKNKATIRTYSIPSNPNTMAQQSVRGAFKEMSKYVAMFADGIKYKSALNVAGMSVRNAIIKINKEMIAMNSFDKASLLVSKGGLQKPTGVTAASTPETNTVKVTFTAPTATNFTEKAEAVVIAVDDTNGIVDVFSAKASTGSATGTIAFAQSNNVQVYMYFLDYRGSNKVASESVSVKITG